MARDTRFRAAHARKMRPYNSKLEAHCCHITPAPSHYDACFEDDLAVTMPPVIQRETPRMILRRALEQNTLAFGTLLYAVFGMALLWSFGETPARWIASLTEAFSQFFLLAGLIAPLWVYPLIFAPVLAIFGGLRRRLWTQKIQILSAMVYCTIFTLTFSLIKGHLTEIVPFWADSALTQLDLALHFGTNPRDALGWMSVFNGNDLSRFYLNSWVFFATYFPVLLLVVDDNAHRRRVFTVLWMACWVILGNVIAVMFMSAGPIFADLVATGTMRDHHGVLALLNDPEGARLLMIKQNLWAAYSGQSEMLGAGISAFPSVHVGMASVLALYVARRGVDFAQGPAIHTALARGVVIATRSVAIVYVSIYLVLSVYLGWHYAVDGYMSIAVICGLYGLGGLRAGVLRRVAAPFMQEQPVSARSSQPSP
ncbi:MAG: phosphatase PAP2 family protein [Celeribacter marinus]